MNSRSKRKFKITTLLGLGCFGVFLSSCSVSNQHQKENIIIDQTKVLNQYNPQNAFYSKINEPSTDQYRKIINNKEPIILESDHSYITYQLLNHQHQLMYDYSFKLLWKLNDQSGNDIKATGWILDYLIPNDGSYPTKWFIATNLHVINNFSFNETNHFFRETILPKNNQQKNGTLYLGFNKAIKNSGILDKKESLYQIKDFKLFFTATDLFNDQQPKISLKDINNINNRNKQSKKANQKHFLFKDFAVLLIDFKYPEIAKEITRNFYNKYKNNPTKFQRYSLLNLSANQLLTWKQAHVFGYPNAVPTINKRSNSEDKYNGAFLTLYDKKEFSNLAKQPLAGLIDGLNLKELSIKNYHSDYLNNLKHFSLVYGFHDSALEPGNSGALVINNFNQVIAIAFGINYLTSTLYAEPLIFEGLFYNNQTILQPYDLIYGSVSKQNNSFKHMMLKYFKNQTSWLLGKL